jgi:2-polyprenyl-3-methyl-5-hydroxy-6-metoxy-1,4-benzoquinol methylase
VFPQPALAGRRFDVVTLVDVIGHVANPVRLLEFISAVLAPDCIAVIVTPHVSSVAARIMGRRWWHYRVAHVCYFNRSTMRSALKRGKLRIEDVERYNSFVFGDLWAKQ